MQYRKVERILEPLSVVGFGCWSSAGYNWTDGSASESERAIQKAIDEGVNVFDVAPVYGYGDSERVLGRALRGRRDKVFLATKCGLRWDRKDGPTRNDLSPASIRWEIDQSLERLGTDHVDLYQMHWPDPQTPIEDTMHALKGLVQQGKIRYIGASNFSVSLCQQAQAVHEIAAHQALYNLFDRNAESYCGIPLEYRTEREIIPYCRNTGMAFIPYSPLCQGVLSGRYYRGRDKELAPGDMRLTNPEITGSALDEKLDVVDQLARVADEAGISLLELAMGWLVANPAITSIIGGARTVEQAISSARTGDLQLGPDVLAAIERAMSREAKPL